MAQSSTAQDLAPVFVRAVVRLSPRNKLPDGVVVDILWIRDYIVDSTRNLHYAETVFEPAMCSTWINQICQRKLMYITQPLERTGTNNLFFVGTKPDEDVDWIAYFTHSALYDGL